MLTFDPSEVDPSPAPPAQAPAPKMLTFDVSQVDKPAAAPAPRMLTFDVSQVDKPAAAQPNPYAAIGASENPSPQGPSAAAIAAGNDAARPASSPPLQQPSPPSALNQPGTPRSGGRGGTGVPSPAPGGVGGGAPGQPSQQGTLPWEPTPTQPLVSGNVYPIAPLPKPALMPAPPPSGVTQILGEEPAQAPRPTQPADAIMLGPGGYASIASVAQPKGDPNSSAQALLDLRDLLLGPAYGANLKSDSGVESLINAALRASAFMNTPEGVALMVTGAGLIERSGPAGLAEVRRRPSELSHAQAGAHPCRHARALGRHRRGRHYAGSGRFGRRHPHGQPRSGRAGAHKPGYRWTCRLPRPKRNRSPGPGRAPVPPAAVTPEAPGTLPSPPGTPTPPPPGAPPATGVDYDALARAKGVSQAGLPGAPPAMGVDYDALARAKGVSQAGLPGAPEAPSAANPSLMLDSLVKTRAQYQSNLDNLLAERAASPTRAETIDPWIDGMRQKIAANEAQQARARSMGAQEPRIQPPAAEPGEPALTEDQKLEAWTRARQLHPVAPSGATTYNNATPADIADAIATTRFRPSPKVTLAPFGKRPSLLTDEESSTAWDSARAVNSDTPSPLDLSPGGFAAEQRAWQQAGSPVKGSPEWAAAVENARAALPRPVAPVYKEQAGSLSPSDVDAVWQFGNALDPQHFSGLPSAARAALDNPGQWKTARDLWQKAGSPDPGSPAWAAAVESAKAAIPKPLEAPKAKGMPDYSMSGESIRTAWDFAGPKDGRTAQQAEPGEMADALKQWRDAGSPRPAPPAEPAPGPDSSAPDNPKKPEGMRQAHIQVGSDGKSRVVFTETEFAQPPGVLDDILAENRPPGGPARGTSLLDQIVDEGSLSQPEGSTPPRSGSEDFDVSRQMDRLLDAYNGEGLRGHGDTDADAEEISRQALEDLLNHGKPKAQSEAGPGREGETTPLSGKPAGRSGVAEEAPLQKAASLTPGATGPRVTPFPVSNDTGQVHDYSNTQANLPPGPLLDRLNDFAARLPDAIVAPKEEGQDQKHITVKYGNPGTDPAPIQEALQGEGPVTATIGKMHVFPGKDGEPDALVALVDSPDLHRLNAKVGAAVDHTGSSFPTYLPHIALDYIQPGTGKDYEGQPIPGVTGQTVTLPSVTFSSKDGRQTEIPLAGSVPNTIGNSQQNGNTIVPPSNQGSARPGKPSVEPVSNGNAVTPETPHRPISQIQADIDRFNPVKVGPEGYIYFGGEYWSWKKLIDKKLALDREMIRARAARPQGSGIAPVLPSPPATEGLPTPQTPPNQPPSKEPGAPPSPVLPPDLAGAKPQYNFGTKSFRPQFANDLDRAAYITAQATPSKQDAGYLKFVMDATGLPESQVRDHGRAIKAEVKELAKDAKGGTLAKPNPLSVPAHVWPRKPGEWRI